MPILKNYDIADSYGVADRNCLKTKWYYMTVILFYLVKVQIYY